MSHLLRETCRTLDSIIIENLNLGVDLKQKIDKCNGATEAVRFCYTQAKEAIFRQLNVAVSTWRNETNKSSCEVVEALIKMQFVQDARMVSPVTANHFLSGNVGKHVYTVCDEKTADKVNLLIEFGDKIGVAWNSEFFKEHAQFLEEESRATFEAKKSGVPDSKRKTLAHIMQDKYSELTDVNPHMVKVGEHRLRFKKIAAVQEAEAAQNV